MCLIKLGSTGNELRSFLRLVVSSSVLAGGCDGKELSFEGAEPAEEVEKNTCRDNDRLFIDTGQDDENKDDDGGDGDDDDDDEEEEEEEEKRADEKADLDNEVREAVILRNVDDEDEDDGGVQRHALVWPMLEKEPNILGRSVLSPLLPAILCLDSDMVNKGLTYRCSGVVSVTDFGCPLSP